MFAIQVSLIPTPFLFLIVFDSLHKILPVNLIFTFTFENLDLFRYSSSPPTPRSPLYSNPLVYQPFVICPDTSLPASYILEVTIIFIVYISELRNLQEVIVSREKYR